MYDLHDVEPLLAIPWGLIAAGAGQLIGQFMQNRSAENISTDSERVALASLMRQDRMAERAFNISREQENFLRRKWFEQEQRLHPYRVAGMGALYAGQSAVPEVEATPEPEPVDWGEWERMSEQDYFRGGASPEGYSRGPTFNVYGGAGGHGYGGAGGAGGRAPGAGPGGSGPGPDGCPEGQYWNPQTRECEAPQGGTDLETGECPTCPDGNPGRPNPRTGQCRCPVCRDGHPPDPETGCDRPEGWEPPASEPGPDDAGCRSPHASFDCCQKAGGKWNPPHGCLDLPGGGGGGGTETGDSGGDGRDPGASPEGRRSPCPAGQSRNPDTGECEDYGGGGGTAERRGGLRASVRGRSGRRSGGRRQPTTMGGMISNRNQRRSGFAADMLGA